MTRNSSSRKSEPNNEPPVAPSTLPPDVIEALDQLNEAELRAAIDYTQERLRDIHPTITEQIEAAPGEEIIRIQERAGYTEVVKRQPCGQNCDDCPHGPYLYHVREEQRPEGGTHLHWVYLGRILE